MSLGRELIEEIDDLTELVELYADEPDNAEEQEQVDAHITAVADTYQKLKLATGRRVRQERYV